MTHNEAEKKALLAKMMEAEVQFMRKNMQPVEMPQRVLGQDLTVKVQPQAKAESPSVQGTALFTAFDKITPANLFERTSAKDRSGNSVDLKAMLQDNPEAMQKLCDALNKFLGQKLQQDFPNLKGMVPFEDDTHIGFKRDPESIDNPQAEVADIEVADIMDRAKGFVASAEPSPLEPLADDHLEEGNEASMTRRL